VCPVIRTNKWKSNFELYNRTIKDNLSSNLAETVQTRIIK